MTLAFRPLTLSNARESRLVVDSWVRSFQSSDTAGMIAAENWFRIMIPEVERILHWPEVRTIVAYEPEDESHLADVQGFISVDTEESVPIVYYVYVKEGYRRSGYARALFAAAGVDPSKPFRYACTTGMVAKIRAPDPYSRVPKRMPFGRWDPNLARFPKDDPRKFRRSR